MSEGILETMQEQLERLEVEVDVLHAFLDFIMEKNGVTTEDFEKWLDQPQPTEKQ
jgi:hypothetical protein